MPGPEVLIPFLVTAAIFAYMPGPAMLYSAAQTLARDRRAGLMAALGIHVGGYVHVLAAAAGLSALFHAVPTLYAMMKLAGAAYLVWLGISLFRSKAESVSLNTTAFPAKSAKRAFLESIIVDVLNPKTALFFVAFLPQFIDVAAGFPIWLQFIILGTVTNIIFSSADVISVLLAGTVTKSLRRSPFAQRLMHRIGGATLIGLGAHLAFQKH